jgi:phage recombination protein Bet
MMATPERALSVVSNIAPTLKLTPEKVELIKRTVAKGATDDELEMFLYLASRYNLDPFLKEIWCIKRAKKDERGNYDYANAPAVIMTSRDGYLKIAQSDPDFDGLKAFVVREGDVFEIDAQEDKVIHKFGAKRGKIIGAWAMCSHKKRKPAICFVDFNEYNANTEVWRKYPSAMIQKVAEVFVLKRQFNINGLVTQEEMSLPEPMEVRQPIDITPQEQRYLPNSQPSQSLLMPSGTGIQKEPNQSKQPNTGFATDKQQKAIYAICKSKGLTEEELRTLILSQTGKETVKEITSTQASDMIKLLQEAPAEELKLLASANSGNMNVLELADSDLPF